MSDLTVTSSPDSCYTGRRGFVTVECREEALRVPLTAELRHRVRALLRRGVRAIVLDVSRVSRIDAVGVGELVRMYNMTRAVNGRLRIAHPTARIRAPRSSRDLRSFVHGPGAGPGVSAAACMS
jgi:ABC-type transporter Mla MlaB component